jgi:hypothetical protein
MNNQLHSQSCYVQLADMSGQDTGPYQSDLELAACSLRESLPGQYQDEFKVYDFGNYTLSEFTNGGILSVWQRLVLSVQDSSEYYLLFFKVSNQRGIYNQIWVDFKLPESIGECFNDKTSIIVQLTNLVNEDLTSYNYAEKKILVMEQFLNLSCEICDNGIDDDNDGYVDCYDLDCVSRTNSSLKNFPNTNKIDVCYNLSDLCVNSIHNYIADAENDAWLQENLDVLEWGLNFMSEYGCSEEIGNYVTDAFSLKRSDNEIVLERMEELFLFLRDNPFGFIEGCPDYDVQTYSDLLNLEIPSSILSQLSSYGLCGVVEPEDEGPHSRSSPYPCFRIQSITEGTSSLVNVDYYSVEIDTMPDFNGDNVEDTPEEVYEEFRKQFADLASGSTSILRSETNCLAPFDVEASWTFEPYDINADLPKWNTRSIGARFFINAEANHVNNFVADDGAIITIQENDFNFIVATIVTPRSDSQPFSGKRMWGLRLNENNKYEIFTRAVDTALPLALIPILGAELLYPDCDDKDYFDIANRTWTTMQDNVQIFIDNNGGASSIKEPNVVHMSFKVFYDKLKSDNPVNFVSCY